MFSLGTDLWEDMLGNKSWEQQIAHSKDSGSGNGVT